MKSMETNIKKLKEQVCLIEPQVRIGKSGLSDGLIGEVTNQLKKKQIIKVKILKSCLEEKNLEDLKKEIATKTNSMIISNTGHTIVLYKKGSHNHKV
jgi:RNA-binding protein